MWIRHSPFLLSKVVLATRHFLRKIQKWKGTFLILIMFSVYFNGIKSSVLEKWCWISQKNEKMGWKKFECLRYPTTNCHSWMRTLWWSEKKSTTSPFSPFLDNRSKYLFIFSQFNTGIILFSVILWWMTIPICSYWELSISIQKKKQKTKNVSFFSLMYLWIDGYYLH